MSPFSIFSLHFLQEARPEGAYCERVICLGDESMNQSQYKGREEGMRKV